MSKLNLISSLWKNKEDFSDIFNKDKFEALTRMIPLIFNGEYQPKKWSHLAIGVGAILYVISPIDILPEIALGPIGILDDVAILAFGLRAVNKELNQFLDWEDNQREIVFAD